MHVAEMQFFSHVTIDLFNGAKLIRKICQCFLVFLFNQRSYLSF